jgi:hypothetical protein
MEQHELPPPIQMLQLLTGFQLSQAFYVAARLGVADHLASGPRPVSELAPEVGAREDMLYRLLRTLASFGAFTESPPGTFALTPLGATLASKGPGSMHDVALFVMETHYEPFGDLLHTVQTGESAMHHLYGEEMWAWLEHNPEHAARFNGAMANLTAMMKNAAAAQYDFGGAGTIVDIGGGNGSLLAQILQRTPDASGILFELPHVLAAAGKTLGEAGVVDRVELVGGSFFEGVPKGDTYLLSQILHDWSDEECAGILGRIREAVPPSGRVVAVDFVVPPGDTPHMSKVVDLAMMCTHTGKERTEREWHDLLSSAGFDLTTIVETPTPISVIEAVPV